MELSLNTFHKSIVKLLVPLSQQETYKLIAREAKKLLDASHGSLYLFRHNTFERVYVSHSTLYKSHIPQEKGRTAKAFKDHSVTIIILKKDAEPILEKLKIKSIIFIPLNYRGKSIGVLTMFTKKEVTLSRKELNILKLFGATASLGIRKAQLFDENKKALETRDLFISIASHELKTPITSIKLFSQIVLKKILKKELPKLEWIETILAESSRLEYLIKELLQVNQVKTGSLQYNWKKCHLREVINRAILDYKIINKKNKIKISDTISKKNDIIMGDFDKLLQVFTNILNNAVKFSPPKSPIYMKLGFSASYFIIEIKDLGIGIEKQKMKKIFDLFYQGEKEKEGLGIGLFLAKTIIKLHKGKILIHSKLHKGTTVKISLPYYKE